MVLPLPLPSLLVVVVVVDEEEVEMLEGCWMGGFLVDWEAMMKGQEGDV